MADRKSSRVAPIATYPWGDIFRGRIDALVQAGIIRADQVPGTAALPDRKSALFIGGVLQPKGKVKPRYDCMRVIRTGDRLLVLVTATQAEQQRREAEEAEEQRRSVNEQAAEDRIEREATVREVLADRVARSEAQFRSNEVEALRLTLERHWEGRRGLSGGYSLDADARQEIEDLVGEISDVFRYRTVVGPAKRKHCEPTDAIDAEAARTGEAWIERIRFRALLSDTPMPRRGRGSEQ